MSVAFTNHFNKNKKKFKKKDLRKPISRQQRKKKKLKHKIGDIKDKFSERKTTKNIKHIHDKIQKYIN